MAVYQWVTLELFDKDNADDLWDLATIFEEIDLMKHTDDIEKSPFIFLIQEYTKRENEERENGIFHDTKGVILLRQPNEKQKVLDLYCETKRKERNKHYMDFALFILNHKQLGNTTEQELPLIEYEQKLKDYQIIAITEEKDQVMKHLLTRHSDKSIYYQGKQIYHIGFPYQKATTYQGKVLQKENRG